MRPHFPNLHYPYIIILLLSISLLPFGNSFVCPDGTRALCCSPIPFTNPQDNKVYQRCKLWLEYFNKPECRNVEGHVCCEIYLANGLGKRCRKATAADSCPATYPPTSQPDDNLESGGGSNPGDAQSLGDDLGSSPDVAFPPGKSGSRSDDDFPNPDEKPGDGDGEGDGRWVPKRPPGLWKVKKVRRRDCGGGGGGGGNSDGAGMSIIPKTSSLFIEEGNGSEYVVPAVAGNTVEEDAAAIAAAGRNGYHAFIVPPGRGDIHDSSFLDFDLVASGLEGPDFFKQTSSAGGKWDTNPADSVIKP